MGRSLKLRVKLTTRDDGPLAAAMESLKAEVSQREQAQAAADALAQVTREIVATLDLDRVAQLIVEAVLRLHGCKSAALYQLEPDSHDLRCLAAAGRADPAEWTGKVLSAGQGVVGRAVAEGHLVYSADFLTDSKITTPQWLRDLAASTGHRSVVSMPLRVRDEAIGALAVGDAAGRIFTDNELRLFAAFADQAALALDNARLFDAERRRRRESEVLTAVSRELIGSVGLAELSDRIASSVLTLVGVQRALLYRSDSESGSLACIAVAGCGDPVKWIGKVLPAGFGVAGLALAERRPVMSANPLCDPRVQLPEWARELLEEQGAPSVLALPLLVDERPLGALVLDSPPGQILQDPAIQLALAFAAQAALALQNASLYDETAQRRKEAEVLAELAGNIGASLELQTILQRATDAAKDLCRADLAWMALREPGTEFMRYQYGAESQGYHGHRIEPGKGIGGQVLVTDRPFRTDNYAEDPRITQDYIDFVRAEAVVTALVVPIRMDGRIEGLFFVNNRSPRPFTDRDEVVLTRLANHAAIALRNAGLYHESQAAERRFRSLFDEVPIGLLRTTPAGQIIDANPAAVQMFRYPSRDALLATSVTALYVNLDERRRLQLLLERDGIARDFAVEARRYDGSTIWVEDNFKIVRNAERQVISYEGSVKDITERKRAEDAVRESERHFRALIENASDGIVLFDAEWTVGYASPSTTRMLGYAFDEIVGRQAFDLIHPDDRACLSAQLGDLIDAPGAIARAAPRVLHKDGSWRVLEAVATNLLADASVRAIVLNFRDITESRQLEEQVRQAQKMEAIGQLAGGVAHDFNNLLTVITGRAEILRRRLAPGDPARRDADLISETAARAAKLTEQLLAFGRKQRLQPKALDLNAVVREVAPMLRGLVGDQIELALALNPDLGTVRADPGQLEQVLVNLAVNARDAMPHGGRFTLETANLERGNAFTARHSGARRGPHVCLSVRDTGVGMDERTLAHIFEPFFTTKELGKGTGLGLSTVYGIVKQHDGYIEVDSAPGRGATFTIYLPRVEGVAECVAPTTAATEELSGSDTVLLVEDDQNVRELAQEVLEAVGYHVIEARHPGEALLIGERYQGTIDLLVTDFSMPQMNGLELAGRLRGLRPDIRILVISAYADAMRGADAALQQSTVLLEKPFGPDALARAVREVLDARGSR
jgi:PAS domain S-box-containing protein